MQDRRKFLHAQEQEHFSQKAQAQIKDLSYLCPMVAAVDGAGIERLADSGYVLFACLKIFIINTQESSDSQMKNNIEIELQ
jgi:hypothetical protein